MRVLFLYAQPTWSQFQSVPSLLSDSKIKVKELTVVNLVFKHKLRLR